MNKLSLIESKAKQSALDLSCEEWKKWCERQGAPSFFGSSIFQWIHQKGNLNPTTFSNISLTIREALKQEFSWHLLEIDAHLISKDGSEKLLLKTDDNLLLEMVVMPYDKRTTLCISSQVGCKMGCTFCQTGKMGLMRNLTAGEILAQLHIANHLLKEKKVTNVVFMGMGEPLDNYDAVVKACNTMVSANGFALSKSRVTISTSGLAPEIDKLGKQLPVRLAISLHNADDAKRSKMMPVNRKYSLEKLKEVLMEYPSPARSGITFEYVMIEGENDSLDDAKKLVHYLHGMKAKVNLIPINHFPGLEMKASTEKRLRRFQSYLSDRSIPAPVRYSRGQDISGGCGQLAAKREGELQMDPRILTRERRSQRRLAKKKRVEEPYLRLSES